MFINSHKLQFGSGLIRCAGSSNKKTKSLKKTKQTTTIRTVLFIENLSISFFFKLGLLNF